MANRDMKLDVLIQLKDQMTGGLNRLTASIEKTSHACRKIGAVGSIVGAVSFMGPMQEAAAFQQQLLDIATTAELSGDKAFAFADDAKKKYEALALHIGQTSHNIAEGAQIMIASGLSTEQIEKSIEGIEKATTAASAGGGDMARLGTSMIQNLKLPADQTKDALGAFLAASKAGSFEMADMAREFPQLTSGFAALGMSGRAAVNDMAAFAEIVRKGTATSSEAATNLKGLLAEVASPHTARAFAKMGVDIQAVMMDATAKGINPLEAAIQKAAQVTGVSSEQISKYMAEAKAHGATGAAAIQEVQAKLEKVGRAGGLSKIFGNQQSREAVVAILANIDEFKEIRDKAAKSTGALIDTDAETKMRGFNVQLTTLGEIGAQAGREVGYAFNAWLPQVNEGLSWLLAQYRQINANTGGFLQKLLSFGALATLASVAIGSLGVALPFITAGFAALGAVVGALLSPIGLLVAALAGLGVMLWRNWDKAAPKLKAFWNGLKQTAVQAWGGIKDAWGKLSPYMSKLWGKMSNDAGHAWRALAPMAGSAFGGIKASIARIFSGINWDAVGMGAITAYDTALRGLGAAWEWLGRVWDGAKPYMQGIRESLSKTFGALGGVVGNIKGIASGLFNLAASLAKLLGFGNGESKFPKIFGDLLGFLGRLGALALKATANILQTITGAISALVSLLNGKMPDWHKLFPEWLTDTVSKITGGISSLYNKVSAFAGKTAQNFNTFLYGDPAFQDQLNRKLHPERYLAEAQSQPVAGAVPGGKPPLPASAAVKVDNKAEMVVKVMGGAAQVSGNFNGQPIKTVADGGLAVGRP